MVWRRYAWHKLTWTHWRSDRDGLTSLAICSCGWKCRLFRVRFKSAKRLWCLMQTHRWGSWGAARVGPAGAPDDAFADVGPVYRFCYRCQKRETS